MKPVSIDVVAALQGYFVVYDYPEETDVDLGEAIIAWRIETHGVEESDDIVSTCIPLTVEGDAASNCIGVQNPDKTVTVFDDASYSSLAELRQARYPKT